MLNRKQFARRAVALLVGPALLYTLGCSDDGIGKRYPVSGTVKYKGEPVAKATISLVPKGQGGGQGAHGEVVNGNFASMTTLNPGDGALPGEYFVTLNTKEIDAEKVAAAGEAEAKKHGMGKMTMVPPELQAKANREAKGSIPAKYESPTTTTLNVKIEEKPNDLKLDLTD